MWGDLLLKLLQSDNFCITDCARLKQGGSSGDVESDLVSFWFSEE